jgi:hypothetical protein
MLVAVTALPLTVATTIAAAGIFTRRSWPPLETG